MQIAVLLTKYAFSDTHKHLTRQMASAATCQSINKRRDDMSDTGSSVVSSRECASIRTFEQPKSHSFIRGVVLLISSTFSSFTSRQAIPFTTE